jgi:hypothetical protein
LEARLDSIDDKLKIANLPTVSDGQSSRQQLEFEQRSIQQCIRFCAEVSSHIEAARQQFEDGVLQTIPPSEDVSIIRAPPQTSLFKEALAMMAVLMAMLQKRVDALGARLMAMSPESADNPDAQPAVDIDGLQEDFQSMKTCLDVCQKAAEQAAPERVHVVDNVDIGDEGSAALVSTVGDLLRLSGISGGQRVSIVIGSLDPTSFQVHSRERTQQLSFLGDKEDSGAFKDRHGPGQKLRTGTMSSSSESRDGNTPRR